jgi:type 1 glutamine amidotransferase
MEDPAFPGMQVFPLAFTLRDEIYQMKAFSRQTTRVLMRLDASKLDLSNPRVHRADRDFAVTWAKSYGKGRVFYTSLGHVAATWDRPDFQAMFIDAIKWAMGLIDAEPAPRPAPAPVKQ